MGIFSAINGKMWMIQRLRHNKIEKKKSNKTALVLLTNITR